jgi:hypothetical protein
MSGQFSIAQTSGHTGRFIMFSMIRNIYNEKNQRTYLNGIVHSHRKTGKVFFDN